MIIHSSYMSGGNSTKKKTQLTTKMRLERIEALSCLCFKLGFKWRFQLCRGQLIITSNIFIQASGFPKKCQRMCVLGGKPMCICCFSNSCLNRSSSFSPTVCSPSPDIHYFCLPSLYQHREACRSS